MPNGHILTPTPGSTWSTRLIVVLNAYKIFGVYLTTVSDSTDALPILPANPDASSDWNPFHSEYRDAVYGLISLKFVLDCATLAFAQYFNVDGADRRSSCRGSAVAGVNSQLSSPPPYDLITSRNSSIIFSNT